MAIKTKSLLTTPGPTEPPGPRPSVISGPEPKSIEGDLPRNEQAKPKLSPLQHVGYNLAQMVLLFMGLVTILLLLHWAGHTPAVPVAPVLPSIVPDDSSTAVITTTAQLQQYQIALQQYETASKVALESSVLFFEQIVTKVLFPLLTAILGYIFGAQSASGQSANEGGG